ncbi:MAG: hypothetical protein JSR75_18605 [Proteobacteria bacterium]|nr:hypothetical protein [Pseudomonadota bacterium]
MYFAGPLTLVSVLVLFVSIATSKRTELSQARCYEAVAGILEAAPQATRAGWEQFATSRIQHLRESLKLGSKHPDAVENQLGAALAQNSAIAANDAAKLSGDSAAAAINSAAAAAAIAAAEAAAAAGDKRLNNNPTPATQFESDIELRHALVKLLIPAELPRGCFNFGSQFIWDMSIQTPTALIQSLRDKAQELKLPRAIRDSGVELPDHATLNIFGTPLRMDLLVFTQWLQLALAPVMALWLGSLYQTRRRECYYIKRMRDIRQLFPHILNVYPQGKLPSLRKRNRAVYLVRAAIPYFVFPFGRLLILAFFVGAPTLTYLMSLFLMAPADQPNLSPLILLILIFLLLAIAFTEFMPGHVGKDFPLL